MSYETAYIDYVLDEILSDDISIINAYSEEDGTDIIVLSYMGSYLELNKEDNVWTAYYYYDGIRGEVSRIIDDEEITLILDDIISIEEDCS